MRSNNTQEIVQLKGDALVWLKDKVPEYLGAADGHGSKTRLALKISNDFIDHFDLGERVLDDDSTFNPLAGISLNNSPATLGTLRSKIARWFMNNAKKSPSASQKIVPALVTFPGPPKKVNGKSLFAESQSSDINAHMNTKVQSLGVSTQHNFKYWQEARDTLWNALSEGEQQEWHARADNHNAQASVATPTPSEIFANQEYLLPTLSAVFEGLVGHGHNQIGNAVFHLQFAYEGPGNLVKSFSLSSQPPHQQPLSTYTDKYTEQITQPFVEWAHMILTADKQKTASDVKVSFDPTGRLMLPEVDMESTSNGQFSKILEDYLQHAWRSVHQSNNSQIPWDEVAEHPHQFIEPQRLPTHIIFKRPRDMLGAHVQLLYVHILRGQSADPSASPPDSSFEFIGPSAEIEETTDVYNTQEADAPLSTPPVSATDVNPTGNKDHSPDHSLSASQPSLDTPTVPLSVGDTIQAMPCDQLHNTEVATDSVAPHSSHALAPAILGNGTESAAVNDPSEPTVVEPATVAPEKRRSKRQAATAKFDGINAPPTKKPREAISHSAQVIDGIPVDGYSPSKGKGKRARQVTEKVVEGDCVKKGGRRPGKGRATM